MKHSILIHVILWIVLNHSDNEGFVIGQTIKLNEYNQGDSDTTCKYGLISGVDTAVFKAEIDYTGITNTSYVHFYIQRKTDAIPYVYCSFNLQKNCTSYTDYRCKQTGPTTLDLELRVKASKDCDGAKIQGKLLTSESIEINSERQMFPRIIDATDFSGKLLVNGKEIPINSDHCMIRVNEPEINIVFVCESQASPCWTEISTNDSTADAVQGVGLTVYNKRLENIQDLFLAIKYGVCSSNITLKIIVCTIKPELRTSTESNSNTFDLQIQGILGITILISVTLILILFVLFYLCLLIKRSGMSRNNQPFGDPSDELNLTQ